MTGVASTTASGPRDARPAYAGREHKWARNRLTRLNNGLRSLSPAAGLLLLTTLINRSVTAENCYGWLNSKYTPFQINAWWMFGITSVVYWAGGLAFMAGDLLEQPRWFYRYKLQPEIKVSVKDYKKVCWIVLRNQVGESLGVSPRAPSQPKVEFSS